VAHEGTAERMLRTVLCSITPIITGASDTGFLDLLMPELTDLFDSARCSALLLDVPGNGESPLRLRAQVGLPAGATTRSEHATGVAARVLRSGQPTLIVDSDDFGARFGGLEPRREVGSSLCVPIATPRGAVFGVLNVSRSAAVAPFVHGDLQVCDAIAMLIGDTLERLQSRETERELRERMFAVERLSVLGEVAAGIAHEIANPMATVHCNVWALAEYLTELAPVLDHAQDDLAAVAADLPAVIGDIREGITRVEEIVSNMKAMVRLERLDTSESVNISKAVHGAIRLVRPRLRSQLLVDVPERLFARGGLMDITQVIVNLVINADDACFEKQGRGSTDGEPPPRSRITVTAGLTEPEPQELPIGPETPPSQRVWIAVTDNGTGIDPATLRRIFMPLFTTKSGYGTGLGLSISRRLVEEQGGQLEVDTTLGVGTTFRICLHGGEAPSA
jgi:signal transduction histidine kinase